MSEPLVSVLTPVYNGEQYLRDCIDSVLAQTYQNWEYITVNNCSTDGSLDIAREYAAREPRIRIHNNDAHIRVAQNYNLAFRQIAAESKYCKAVASDDMILPECLERMVRLAEAHPSVGIVGAYGIYSDAAMGVYSRGVPYLSPVMNGRALARAYLLEQGPSVFGSATYLLFRAALLRSRHAFFNESNFHCDSEACLDAMERYDFGFVQQILTFTRVREGSLTALTQEINTYLPYRLYALTAYGKKYLSDGELETQIRKTLGEYYDYLGWQLPKRRGREFWKFHRDKLAALGYPLSRTRLAAHAAAYALNLVFNPRQTVTKVARRLDRTLRPSPS